MADSWEVEVAGQVYEVQADTPQQAATYAKLLAARETGVSQAEQGAMQRSQVTPAEEMQMRSERLKTPNPQKERELELATRAAQYNPDAAKVASGVMGLTAGAGAVGAGGLAPFVKGTIGALGGGAAGQEAGEWAGRKFPIIGGEGLGSALGAVGGIGGSILGGSVAPKVDMRSLLQLVTGGRGGGLLTKALGGAEAIAAKPAATAAKNAAGALARPATERATLTAAEKLAAAERRDALRAEANALKRAALEARGVKVPPTKPPSVPKPGETPAPKAEILPDGQRGWSQSKGGPAKPGPEPTPETELEATLRASIDAEKAKKAAAAGSPLQGPRLQIGAEKVGKPLGMTKEEVRLQAGPRLDEALGDASPILPDVPFGKIIDTMKALPKTGGFREAYVARATSGKTKWQVENIRRQLEHLGLLVPAGVAAGMAEE